MPSPLDDHGQPASPFLNRSARIDRAVDELIGFLKGVIADDVVTTPEVERLGEWLLLNREVLGFWPVNALSSRLNRIFEDGRVDDEEREDLRRWIHDLLGSRPQDIFVKRSTRLPLTKPAPEVIFDRNAFIFTGRFLFGTRKQCQREICERGGECLSAVTRKAHYLVIGDLGSEDWAHSIYGRKIETAIQYGIQIISEEHWVGYLLPAPNTWKTTGA